jgi:hypothetical protein
MNDWQLKDSTTRTCVCGREITCGYLNGQLITMHESPGCELYLNFQGASADEFMAHLAGRQAFDGPKRPRTDAEKHALILELAQEFLPRFLPLIPENRVTYPVDSTKVAGDALRSIMCTVGGNYEAIAEFIRLDADYLVSFGLLNNLVDCIRNQETKPSNTGNA